MNKGLSELSDSLLLDAAGGSEGHVPRVRLGLAAVPQIDEGLAHAHHHHGDPRAQAAAVTHHLQQVALLRHLPAHAVQTPVAWGADADTHAHAHARTRTRTHAHTHTHTDGQEKEEVRDQQ